jgi:ribosome-associated translation inhibitor RaiA
LKIIMENLFRINPNEKSTLLPFQIHTMTIQFNTDKNIAGSEKFNSYFSTLIEEALGRFNDKLTRVEAHLSDENGGKEGPGDKRCVLEARIEGRQPIAVSNIADTPEKAVEGAIDKLKTSLQTIMEKMNNHN